MCNAFVIKDSFANEIPNQEVHFEETDRQLTLSKLRIRLREKLTKVYSGRNLLPVEEIEQRPGAGQRPFLLEQLLAGAGRDIQELSQPIDEVLVRECGRGRL